MGFEIFDLNAGRPASNFVDLPQLEGSDYRTSAFDSASQFLPELDLVTMEADEAPAEPESLDRTRATTLIKDLGSATYRDRENAQRGLEKMGPAVLPLLHEAANSNEPLEVRTRAGRAIQAINCTDLDSLLTRYEKLGVWKDNIQKFSEMMANWRGPKLLYDQEKVEEVAKGLSEAVMKNSDLTPHVAKYHDLLNDFFVSGAGKKAGLGNLGTLMAFNSMLTAELKQAGLNQEIVFLWDQSTPPDLGAIYQVRRNNKVVEFQGAFTSGNQRVFKESK